MKTTGWNRSFSGCRRAAHWHLNYRHCTPFGCFDKGKILAMVKCSQCGLLAIRDFPGTRIIEVTEEVRQTGLTPDCRAADVFCFVNKRNFKWPEALVPQIVIPEINREISCDCWQTYRQGKGPKEHEEMTLLEQQRQWQREEQSRHEAREDRRDKRQLIALYFAGIALLIAAIGQGVTWYLAHH